MSELQYETQHGVPDPRHSLPEIFYRHALDTPEDVVHCEVQLKASGPDAEPVTYRELLSATHRAADQLHRRGVQPEDRVVLMTKTPSCFLAYFFGAIGLGAVPVPLPSAGKLGMPESFHQRIRNVSRDCEPRIFVAQNAQWYLKQGFDRQLEGGWLEAEKCLGDDDNSPQPPDSFDLERPLDEIAYLQYTSGSTGDPRGVIITQRNLSSNLYASARAGCFSSRDRCVSWLPLYHDMGLIGGPLLGIYLKAPPYLMTPSTFVTAPVSWLEACDEFGATFTVAPNFAYSIVAHKVPDSAIEGLDLGSLRLAFNGGEPIDSETVEKFLQRFRRFGFARKALYPVYGLAESTLAVAFPDPDEEVVYDRVDREQLTESGDANPVEGDDVNDVTFVGVGRVVPDHDVTIRDPETGQECPERRVGEVTVRGPSVSPGYFTANADSVTDRQSPPEVATGDLGYLADGQLFIVDRIKDLIIIAGRNFVPSDIERQIAPIEGIRRGAVAAFGVRSDQGTERLCLVAEFNPKSLRALRDVEAEIKQVVRTQFSLPVAGLVLAPPNSIPKTSSGKIRRHKTREMYTGDEFESVHQWITRIKATKRSLSKNLKRWIAARKRP